MYPLSTRGKINGKFFILTFTSFVLLKSRVTCPFLGGFHPSVIYVQFIYSIRDNFI